MLIRQWRIRYIVKPDLVPECNVGAADPAALEQKK